MTKVQFYIEGMTCSACSSGIERSLGRKAYVKEVGVDLLSKKAFVVYDESQASLEDIFKQIGKLGYSAQKKPLKDLLEPSFLTPNLKLLFILLSALVVLCLSMFAPLLPLPALLKDPLNNGLVQLVLTLIAMHMGRNFYIHGFKALWARQPNMDSLIALGTSAAFMYSLVLLLRAYNHTLIDGYYFESVCVILLFVMGGKRVEQSSKDKALQAMQELMQEHNSTALKVENGQDSEVAIESLQQGDILRVLPGAYVPVDGVLIQGASEIDESMLSGESVPVFKKEGAKVFAGTLNTHSAFLMQATHNKAQSTLAKILDLIAKAQGSKAPIARLADKVAGVFVPAVIAIASLAFIVWVFKAGFKEALEVFIAVLVISCPCALGLATPMALLVAQKEAGLLGLFFKDAKSLERAKDISHVLLDKTGTITLGKPVVKEVRPAGGVALLDLLGLCASLEAQSEHVIAKSLVKYAKEQGALLQEVQGVKASAGLGVSGLVGGQEYRAGNLEFFSEGNHLGEFEGIGVFVGTPGKILGLIVLEDQLKEGAKEAIEGMHSYGLKTLLLSGDREASVAKIAAELQMEYKAGAKPQDKLATLEDLQKGGAVVMMVGDGLNDAPALAKSDVGVVMGLGSGASLEVADILSLNNHPSAALQAIKLSKLTITNIKQNLFWAFCYNALAIPLACGIAYPFMLNPMLASLAMSLSSLSVVFNAQRLRGVHKKIKG
ncbi:Lead, cadmium, zinc and mercury transporting ATPase; Copper-translocating P-type ATPase [Helicobacter heilmannii]|uniref:heavy metal translocating P-type ATPase n=1 Tax=Helicobacter heilmannii TaxID=35817 RepID=UPI0006A0A43F|nr:heavy metal translocating P-type ATPase [Helicobacter heilmannii]CRF49110.1 Lead, cadmium, zinc and mercury transporting ATPase; Copper-translocating P-type ATPase [Helicobacter heilmannii]